MKYNLYFIMHKKTEINVNNKAAKPNFSMYNSIKTCKNC